MFHNSTRFFTGGCFLLMVYKWIVGMTLKRIDRWIFDIFDFTAQKTYKPGGRRNRRRRRYINAFQCIYFYVDCWCRKQLRLQQRWLGQFFSIDVLGNVACFFLGMPVVQIGTTRLDITSRTRGMDGGTFWSVLADCSEPALDFGVSLADFPSGIEIYL